MVKVPVLSVAITSTEPNVSTAGNVLMMVCLFLAISLTPIAKTTEVVAGKPSGIEPTIIVTTAKESTERAYDLKEMHRVVNKLPKEYRVPFAMHVSGFKYREIAEKLNLPLGTVKSRIFFTRQKLQEELKDFR